MFAIQNKTIWVFTAALFHFIKALPNRHSASKVHKNKSNSFLVLLFPNCFLLLHNQYSQCFNEKSIFCPKKKKNPKHKWGFKVLPKDERTVLLLNSPNVPQWMMATQQPLKHWLQGKALGCPSGPGKQQRHTLTHSASLPVLHRALPNQPLISLSKFGSRGTWMC